MPPPSKNSLLSFTPALKSAALCEGERHIILSAAAASSAVICLDICPLISMPFSAQAMRELTLTPAPFAARPRLSTVTPGSCFERRYPSAIGLRQVLPVQTNKIFI